MDACWTAKHDNQGKDSIEMKPMKLVLDPKFLQGSMGLLDWLAGWRYGAFTAGDRLLCLISSNMKHLLLLAAPREV